MNRKFIILLFFLAISSSLLWGHKMLGVAPTSDGAYYNEIALNLLDKHKLIYQAGKSAIEPGYPAFISGVYLLFGENNYNAVRTFQIILFALSVIIIYFISRKIFNEKTATIAGLSMAIFYGFALSAIQFHREILTMFFLSILLYTLYQCFFTKKLKWFLASGIILGSLVLINAITQLLFIFIISVFIIIFKKKVLTKKIALNILVFFAAYLLVIGSLSIMNKASSNSYSLVSRGGKLLLQRTEVMERLYNNYSAYFIGHTFGYYFTEKLYPGIELRAYRNFSKSNAREEELFAEDYSITAVNSILRQEAVQKFVAMPHKYFLMSFLDFISFNNPFIPSNNNNFWSNCRIHMMFTQGTHPELNSFIKAGIILSVRIIWFIFFTLIIYGIIKFKDKWHYLVLILSVIIYFNLFYSLIHAIPRYALPIYPLYIMLFSLGFSLFIYKFPKRFKLLNKLLNFINPEIK